MLDLEEAPFDGTHEVTVRATDPYGDPNVEDAVEGNSDEVAVTITVDNVNEAPMITAGPTKDSKAEDFDSGGEGRQLVVATYGAADDDEADTDATLDWSLTGPGRCGLQDRKGYRHSNYY